MQNATIQLRGTTYTINPAAGNRYEVHTNGERVGGFIRGPNAEIHLFAQDEKKKATVGEVAAISLLAG